MSDDAAARKAQVRAVFNRIAPEYDAGPGCFAHYGRRLVEVAGVGSGERVLDVATGRGAILFPAAERVGATGRIVGVDLSEAMVRATSAEAARRGLTAEVRTMDAEELDFPDASFDRVLCGFGIMFFPDLAGALAEFRRVIKPGGILGVSTWRVAQADDLAAVIHAHGFADTSSELDAFRDPAALERALVAAGFADVRVRDDPTVFRYASIEEYWQTARGTGLRRWLDRLDAAQATRARELLAERVRPHQRPDGIGLAASANLAVARR